MSVISNNILAGSSGQGGGAAGYAIDRSLRFNSADSAYLNRTPSSAGNRKTWTWSGWVKLGKLGVSRYLLASTTATNDASWFTFLLSANNKLYFTPGYNTDQYETTAIFRDPSAWYHVVFSVDTTLSALTSRYRIYVNGTEYIYTGIGAGPAPAQNIDHSINNTGVHNIGRYPFGAADYFNGYLADIHFIDGQALTPSDFGEFDDNGVWQPKEFAGTYGTNGFHLDFSDNSSNAALGTDTSGNGNTWTVNNLSVAAGAGNDSLRDTPEQRSDQTDSGVGNEIVGNYCVWNPLDKNSSLSLSNGNLDASAGAFQGVNATFDIPVGSWYWEVTVNIVAGANGTLLGMIGAGQTSSVRDVTVEGLRIMAREDGAILKDGTTNQTGLGSWSDGDVFGCAYNATSNSIQFYRNGSPYGNAITPTAGTYVPWCGSTSNTASFSANFGQRAFAYTAPSGFKALCTTNLPDPTIADGSTYFDTKLWTGITDSSTPNQTITGYNFSPDFVWVKCRSHSSNHGVFDIVRGAENMLHSDTTDSVDTLSTNTLKSFNSDGFTLNDPTWGGLSYTGRSFVGWAWDAGSSNTTIAAGSLNSSAYNQTDWSGSTTATNIATNVGNDLASVFDGNLANGTRAANNGGTGTLQWSSGTIQGRVRVYTGIAGTQGLTYYNGSASTTISSANNGWNDLGSIDLTRLDFVYSGGNITFVNAIELDGRLLINSTVTPPNVPSIASTVRANPSAGFSIVSYSANNTAVTVGHGLNAAPSLIIAKGRNANLGWKIYHKSLGVGGFLEFDTGAFYTAGNYWGSSVNSSTFGVSAGGDIALNDMIAYCFAPVEGYSAMGSYTGNGSADGPFVFTGFRPRWVIIKATSFSEHWYIYDTVRKTFNVNQYPLLADSSNGGLSYEGIADGGQAIDILSNGFKIRGAWLTNNTSQNYIYAAFAENPFKTARAR